MEKTSSKCGSSTWTSAISSKMNPIVSRLVSLNVSESLNEFSNSFGIHSGHMFRASSTQARWLTSAPTRVGRFLSTASANKLFSLMYARVSGVNLSHLLVVTVLVTSSCEKMVFLSWIAAKNQSFLAFFFFEGSSEKNVKITSQRANDLVLFAVFDHFGQLFEELLLKLNLIRVE